MKLPLIALYLDGKFTPYYGIPFDKLRLIEIIRENSYKSFSEDMFKLIDSKDFYLNCLNRVKRCDSENLRTITDKLELPDELKYDIIIK